MARNPRAYSVCEGWRLAPPQPVGGAGAANRERSAPLWGRFEAWRVTADVPPCSQTALGRALRSLGYECECARYARWYGLRLIPTGVAKVETTLAQPARSEFPA